MTTLPQFFQKLENSLRRSKTELEAKQLEVDRQILESSELKERLRSLNADVQRYTDQLQRADEQFNRNQEGLQTFKDAVLTGWGRSDSPGAPTYREIVALEGAIADYPRVRSFILSKITEAKEALRDLERMLPE